MTKKDEWASARIKEDDRLYELYGKALEEEYSGKFVALKGACATLGNAPD